MPNIGYGMPGPVLIVGGPRSGTTMRVQLFRKYFSWRTNVTLLRLGCTVGEKIQAEFFMKKTLTV